MLGCSGRCIAGDMRREWVIVIEGNERLCRAASTFRSFLIRSGLPGNEKAPKADEESCLAECAASPGSGSV